MVYSSLRIWLIKFSQKWHRTLQCPFALEVLTYSVELDRGLNLLPLIFFLLPPRLPEKRRFRARIEYK